MKTVILAAIMNILFVDVKTGETLTGVKVETDKHSYYSNLDGIVNIPNEEKIIRISYVSYQDVNKEFVPSDTTIKLLPR